MTTLAAWASVDSRSPSSCYLVSDSRISWPDGTAWNSGQKLFASRRFADIFGYCGDVQFPTLALRQVVDLMDAGLLFADDTPAPERNRRIVDALTLAYADYAAHPEEKSTIVHVARDGIGRAAAFSLWRFEWSQSSPLLSTQIETPVESVLAVTLGSGWKVLIHRNEEWKAAQGRTSRGVFSSFCDAILSGDDPKTGGPPQLVGVYRDGGMGRMFGIILDGRRFLAGQAVSAAANLDDFEWRNGLFERMNPWTLKRLDTAQPQPRPRQRLTRT